MLAISHLPTFGGTFSAFARADHASNPMAAHDPCIEAIARQPASRRSGANSAESGGFATPSAEIGDLTTVATPPRPGFLS
jgi:hypothetical protein